MTGKPVELSVGTKKVDENPDSKDSNFVQPSKRKIISNSISQPKRYVLDANQLGKQNKYQVLLDHSYASNGSNVDTSDKMEDITFNEQLVGQKVKFLLSSFTMLIITRKSRNTSKL